MECTGLRKLARQLCASLVLLLFFSPASASAEPPAPDIEVFVRAGCPHCEAAKAFLDGLQREQPSLRIAVYDIAEDFAARQRLTTLVAERGLTSLGVPIFLIGTELIVGFRSAGTTGAELCARLTQRTQSPVPPQTIDSIQTGWVGELRVRDLDLPLFTVVIGRLDGFNPCAMWVLLFPLSLLVNLHDRLKMAGLGAILLLRPKWLM